MQPLLADTSVHVCTRTKRDHHPGNTRLDTQSCGAAFRNLWAEPEAFSGVNGSLLAKVQQPLTLPKSAIRTIGN
jgi:hypothetical protein